MSGEKICLLRTFVIHRPDIALMFDQDIGRFIGGCHREEGGNG
jgi:hypothetical protein